MATKVRNVSTMGSHIWGPMLPLIKLLVSQLRVLQRGTKPAPGVPILCACRDCCVMFPFALVSRLSALHIWPMECLPIFVVGAR